MEKLEKNLEKSKEIKAIVGAALSSVAEGVDKEKFVTDLCAELSKGIRTKKNKK